MALTTCKECKHQVSSQAATCPSCGAPIARAPRKTSVGTIITASLIVVGIIAAIASSDHSSTPDKNPIKTQAGLTDSAVVISNLNDFEWPAVTIYVNGTPLDGYSAGPYGPVPPKRDLSIPLSKFVKGDLRFNAYERKVNKVIVSVNGHDAPVFAFH